MINQKSVTAVLLTLAIAVHVCIAQNCDSLSSATGAVNSSTVIPLLMGRTDAKRCVGRKPSSTMTTNYMTCRTNDSSIDSLTVGYWQEDNLWDGFYELTSIRMTCSDGSSATGGILPLDPNRIIHERFPTGGKLDMICFYQWNPRGTQTILGMKFTFVNDPKPLEFGRVKAHHSEYCVKVGSSQLRGFAVASVPSGQTSMMNIGLLMDKEVSFMELKNVRYPLLMKQPNPQPISLSVGKFQNPSDVASEQTLSFTRTVGRSDSFTIGGSFSVSASMSISVEVPVASATVTTGWSLSAEVSRTTSTDETITGSIEAKVAVPPQTTCEVTITFYNGVIKNLAWNGWMFIQYTDGTNVTVPASGTYNSVVSTEVQTSQTCVPYVGPARMIRQRA